MNAELAEKLKALEEQVAVIKDENLRKIAFEKLLEAALPSASARRPNSNVDVTVIEDEEAGAEDLEGFCAKFSHEAPADNAVALAAFHYGQYGRAAFSVDEIRGIADRAGVTVPTRLDMTFVQARRGGKLLFQRAGRGAFAPSVAGELYFKKTYQVAKGTKVKAKAEQGE